jgi:hypothetical protein
MFGGDPLLLSEQNQSEYGRAMLRHLLIFRPLTTSKPHIVDLQAPTAPNAAASSVTVTPAMRTAYEKAFRERNDLSNVGLSDPEINSLRKITMTPDGSTHERADNKIKNHELIRNALPQHERDDFDQRLRISAIGLRIKISKRTGQSLLGEDLFFYPQFVDTAILPHEHGLTSHLGRTAPSPTPSADLDDWHQALRAQVMRSLVRLSQIVVLPEFGLAPPLATRPPIEQTLAAASRHAPRDNFVFGGTRHEDRYNRGPILSKRHGTPSARDHWHLKATSALSLGENVIGRAGIHTPSYQTSVRIGSDEALIGIAVCYDTYDPTTFINLFLDAVRTYDGSIPRFILVPSFNPSSDFVALLRDLSFLARCAVVYVNGLHGDSTLFMCGFDITDFDNTATSATSAISARLQDLQNDINQITTAAASGAISQRQYRFRSLKKRQLQHLKKLQQRLDGLRKSKHLDHLMTYEDCPVCAAGTAHPGKECYRDIAYYNLHPGLLAALIDFRKYYFGAEMFLPEPLRWHELDKAAAVVDAP